ncbi:uncharacterized protein LOC144569885 [Carex rostrata]
MTARGFPIFSSSSFATGHLPCSSSLICANNAYAGRTGIIRKLSINHCSRLGNFKLAYSVNSCLVSTLLALAVVLPSPDDTFMNVPPTLSGDDIRKKVRIQRPKTKQAERCTSKCMGTCILGGAGSPGEGPLNVRRPLVVFKEEFRSRRYCLRECTDICNLIKDGEDGP